MKKLNFKITKREHKLLFLEWTSYTKEPLGWKYADIQPDTIFNSCNICRVSMKVGIKDNGNVLEMCDNCEVIYKEEIIE